MMKELTKFKNSRVYREILEHRRNCPKWGKEFCLECFGNGLNKTFDVWAREMDRMILLNGNGKERKGMGSITFDSERYLKEILRDR